MIPNPDASYRRQRGRLRRSALKNANATVGGDRAPAIRQQAIVLSLDLSPGKPRLEHIPLTRSSGHLLAPWSFNSVEPAASEQSTVPWDERGIAGPAFSRDRLFGAAESL